MGQIQFYNDAILFCGTPKTIAMDPACCPAACTYCSGSAPDEIAVTLAGFVDDDCAQCDLLNDDFVLSFEGNLGSPYDCRWSYTGEPYICADTYRIQIHLYLQAYGSPVSGCIVRAVIYREYLYGFPDDRRFTKIAEFSSEPIEPKPACTDLGGTELTLETAYSMDCDFTGATITIAV